MEGYNPICTLTAEVENLAKKIIEKASDIPNDYTRQLNEDVHRTLRTQSVYSSIKIENNSLSIEQVANIVAGKSLVCPEKDIQEAINADSAYCKIQTFNPLNVNDLLKAHGLLTQNVIKESGTFRKGGVGIHADEVVIHVAPPADLVQYLIYQLFNWYKTSSLHPLIKSCIFHYEFEFIHPFADGNGRVGRLWQKVQLGSWHDVFYILPVEAHILEHQQSYYNAYIESTSQVDCAPFVEFMLQIILETILEPNK